jgi:hypothetical protein
VNMNHTRAEPNIGPIPVKPMASHFTQCKDLS